MKRDILYNGNVKRETGSMAEPLPQYLSCALSLEVRSSPQEERLATSFKITFLDPERHSNLEEHAPSAALHPGLLQPSAGGYAVGARKGLLGRRYQDNGRRGVEGECGRILDAGQEFLHPTRGLVNRSRQGRWQGERTCAQQALKGALSKQSSRTLLSFSDLAPEPAFSPTRSCTLRG